MKNSIAEIIVPIFVPKKMDTREHVPINAILAVIVKTVFIKLISIALACLKSTVPNIKRHITFSFDLELHFVEWKKDLADFYMI